jgi:hypothetical protein
MRDGSRRPRETEMFSKSIHFELFCCVIQRSCVNGNGFVIGLLAGQVADDVATELSGRRPPEAAPGCDEGVWSRCWETDQSGMNRPISADPYEQPLKPGTFRDNRTVGITFDCFISWSIFW